MDKPVSRHADNPSARPPYEPGVLSDPSGPIPVFPPRSWDKHGRLDSISDEERTARIEAARRALAALGQITDDTDTEEAWRDIYRRIDEGRPHRKLFQDMD